MGRLQRRGGTLAGLFLMGILGMGGGCGTPASDSNPIQSGAVWATGDPSLFAAQAESYVRKAWLDVAGTAPDQASLETAVEVLVAAGGSDEARFSFATSLSQSLQAAETFWAWMAGRSFGSATDVNAEYEQLFYFLSSSGIEGKEPGEVLEEWDRVMALPSALAKGEVSHREVARQIQGSILAHWYASGNEWFLDSLFRAALDRAPSSVEVEQGKRALSGGEGENQAPAVLFGTTCDALEGLGYCLFDSRAWSDSAIDLLFNRLLGRPPSPEERVWLGRTYHQDNDLAAVMARIVASREYARP